jgi:hypothetical protein
MHGGVVVVAVDRGDEPIEVGVRVAHDRRRLSVGGVRRAIARRPGSAHPSTAWSLRPQCPIYGAVVADGYNARIVSVSTFA